MLNEEHLQKFTSFLVSFKNLKAWRKVEKAGYSVSSAYKIQKSKLSDFGYSLEEINNIYNNYEKIALEEIEKGKGADVDIVHFDDENYPDLLKEIYNPPEFLYVKGDCATLKAINKKIAIVGSRKNNSYGKEILDKIVPDLCKSGLVIVSGMAYGIDSYSHNIAVKNGGKTIGVNAGGLLNLYPVGNASLFPKIVDNGCIISEFPLDVVPRPFFFPIRNRIISGISKAVFVVQANIKSGSLITARVAVEQNRDVFTVPGHIYSKLSKGPHYLLKQGAKLIENSSDILDEFGINLKKEKPKNIFITEKEMNLLDLIDDNSVKKVDYFVENSDLIISEVISVLMGLVLKGVLIETNDGYRKIVDE